MIHSNPTHAASGSAVMQAVGLAVAYFLIDHALNRGVLGNGWQIFWPMNGLTVALLVMRAPRQWPLIIAATTTGLVLGELLEDPPRVVVPQTFLSDLEVLMSAALLPRFTDVESWLRTPNLHIRFTAAVIVPPVATALVQTGWTYLIGNLPYKMTFESWALPDILGVAAVVPLVLSAHSMSSVQLRSWRWWRSFVGILTLAVVAISTIFATSNYPLIFVLYPLLMWIDWRLGLLGSSSALCCACLISVFLTEHGYGPFATTHALGVSVNLAVQIYLAFHLIGFLPVSILIIEKRRIDRELRESLARADALALTDGLTNVANRRCFDERLAQKWLEASRRHSSVALLMIDADFFKQFNDQLGHQAGDDCLRAIAASIRRQLTGPEQLAARFGGEEFAVLLPDTSIEEAEQVAESIRAAVLALAIVHPGSQQSLGRVSVSIGCAALIPQGALTAHTLVEAADSALYKAKGNGRNRVWVEDSRSETATVKLLKRLEAFRMRGS